mmetsp:Transcript_29333/g.61841  ORF Transcript_29333/g.61841 Transcript_29333/m.61841 type:complete len:202 (+) Transcript_29333:1153-1758(+)
MLAMRQLFKKRTTRKKRQSLRIISKLLILKRLPSFVQKSWSLRICLKRQTKTCRHAKMQGAGLAATKFVNAKYNCVVVGDFPAVLIPLNGLHECSFVLQYGIFTTIQLQFFESGRNLIAGAASSSSALGFHVHSSSASYYQIIFGILCPHTIGCNPYKDRHAWCIHYILRTSKSKQLYDHSKLTNIYHVHWERKSGQYPNG